MKPSPRTGRSACELSGVCRSRPFRMGRGFGHRSLATSVQEALWMLSKNPASGVAFVPLPKIPGANATSGSAYCSHQPEAETPAGVLARAFFAGAEVFFFMNGRGVGSGE